MRIWCIKIGIVLVLHAKSFECYATILFAQCWIQLFLGPHAVWYVSYQSLSRSWHTDFDYGLYRLSNLEIGLTVGVTGQQEMLTPLWHLIPPACDIFSGPCSPIHKIVSPISYRTYEIDYCSLFLSFHAYICSPVTGNCDSRQIAEKWL
jgi:hypothetical protein